MATTTVEVGPPPARERGSGGPGEGAWPLPPRSRSGRPGRRRRRSWPPGARGRGSRTSRFAGVCPAVVAPRGPRRQEPAGPPGFIPWRRGGHEGELALRQGSPGAGAGLRCNGEQAGGHIRPGRASASRYHGSGAPAGGKVTCGRRVPCPWRHAIPGAARHPAHFIVTRRSLLPACSSGGVRSRSSWRARSSPWRHSPQSGVAPCSNPSTCPSPRRWSACGGPGWTPSSRALAASAGSRWCPSYWRCSSSWSGTRAAGWRQRCWLPARPGRCSSGA